MQTCRNETGFPRASSRASCELITSYGKLATSIAPNLLPAFVAAALAKGETARLYWTGDAIASPPVLIVDKESLLARIDP